MAYLLCPLSSDQMHVLYQWKINEPNWDLYTCRPVGELPTEPEFIEKSDEYGSNINSSY